MSEDSELERLKAKREKLAQELQDLREAKTTLGRQCADFFKKVQAAIKAEETAKTEMDAKIAEHNSIIEDFQRQIRDYQADELAYDHLVMRYQADVNSARLFGGDYDDSAQTALNGAKILRDEAKKQIDHLRFLRDEENKRFMLSGFNFEFIRTQSRTIDLKREAGIANQQNRDAKAAIIRKQAEFDEVDSAYFKLLTEQK